MQPPTRQTCSGGQIESTGVYAQPVPIAPPAPTQTSVVVQAAMSLHSPLFGTCWQSRVRWQVGTVQLKPSVSEQLALLGVCETPVTGSHASSVQATPSLVLTGVWETP